MADDVARKNRRAILNCHRREIVSRESRGYGKYFRGYPVETVSLETVDSKNFPRLSTIRKRRQKKGTQPGA
ncbi:unnamed protein product [Lasius platythorax]|uniref:Uncharacterized protein n=1 Tax=Lasius platythorax TaxID=488582 RepID=A0AAV2NI74_9HYME